jgi:hypothetical protein
MLSLEVVGPGYGLSTAPSATPYWRDASWGSWQAVTATAAYSCDRAVRWRRYFFGWRAAGGGDGGSAPALTAMGSRFLCVIFRHRISAFFLVHSAHNSASLYYFSYIGFLKKIRPISWISYKFDLH